MESTDKRTTPVNGGNYANAKRRSDAPAHDAVDRTVRGAHETVDRATEVADRAKESLSEKGEEAREAANHVVAKTRTYIKGHPVASMGIAVLAGLVLSQLLRSGSH